MRSQPLFSIDSRSLTLFRICVCLWTFRDLFLSRLWNFEAWHTDDGVLKPYMTPHKSFIHQILFYRGSFALQAILFFIHFIITCNLFIGYKTQISSILHFIFTISIHERMYYVLDGGDRLFRHLAFWLIFLPSWHGQNTSIDSIHIQNKRKRCLAMLVAKNNKSKSNKSKKSKNQKINTKQASITPINNCYSMIRSYATCAILIQSMIIYPFIMLNRYRGGQRTWYWDKCTAVHNSMASYTMSTDFGIYLAGYPILTFLLCRATVLLETALPMLILIVPWDIVKLLIIIILGGMQFGFNIFIRVENFGYSVATSMVLFIPSLFWDWLDQIIQRNQRLKSIQMKVRGALIYGARSFKMFERIGNRNMENDKKKIKDLEIEETVNGVLWDIPIISDEEKDNIDMIQSSKDIGLLQPEPTKLNRYLSLFFLVYLFINNLGDVQLRLFPKPDGGNIGELLRIDQQWVMYGPDVTPSTSFQLLMGEIEIIEGDKTYKKRIVLNDLLTSNWKQVTVFEGEKKYKRPWNPTNINPSMRWERLLVKSSTKSDMMNSILFWFCKHVKDRNLRLRYQNHEKRYDDQKEYVKMESVFVNKMLRGGWCNVHGDIIDLWKQNTSISLPQYQNEYTRCYNPVVCPRV